MKYFRYKVILISCHALIFGKYCVFYCSKLKQFTVDGRLLSMI